MVNHTVHVDNRNERGNGGNVFNEYGIQEIIYAFFVSDLV